LDIDLGGLQIDVTEEVFDHDEGNTGLQKMHRFGVPHSVRTDPDTSQRWHGTCGPPQVLQQNVPSTVPA
jgi:hypothetical protein